MNRVCYLTFVGVGTLVACSTSMLNVGHNDTKVVGDGGACQATCSTPAGTVQVTSSLAQAYAQLQGQWLFCSGQQYVGGPPADAIGVEFAAPPADGGCGGLGDPPCGESAFYYLVQGSTGPVRGSGFDYQLTYDISGGGDVYFVNVHPAPNAQFGGSFRYSPCPKEIELPDWNYAPTPPLLVAMDAMGRLPDDAGSEPTVDASVSSVSAACAPAGPEQPIVTIADGETAVAGRWQICTGLSRLQAFAGANDIVGMEFAPATDGGGDCQPGDTCAGGDLYFLVSGSSGPVRGQGFAYQATYALIALGSSLQLNLSNSPNGFADTSILYSLSPRELDFTSLGLNDGATLQAIP
jgi:hypothetical protein